jgi:multiple sugar transport system substrate-binding protein
MSQILHRLAVLSLAAALLAACGAPATPAAEPTAAQPTAEPAVTLDFTAFPLWSGVTGTDPDGEGRDYWDKIAGEFSQQHPNVTINVEMGDWETNKEVLTARLAANNPPDVTYMCDQDTRIYRDQLVPMDAHIDAAYRADVTADTWNLYTVDGSVRALPAMAQWNALIINADLFRERGVPLPPDPDRAWTWDEFMSAVEQLTFDRDGDGQTDVYGTAVAGINWDIEWYNLHYGFNRGARFMDPSLSTFTINDEKGVEYMQWLLDLQDVHQVIPPGAAGLSLDDVYQMLFRGQVAMFHGAPWVISWMESSVASGELESPVDLQIVQYPHFEGETMVTDLASCGFAVFDRPDEPYRTQKAVELALFLTSAEKLRDWKAGGYLPARLSAMEGLYDDNPNLQALIGMAPYARFFWSRESDIMAYADQFNAVIPSVFNHEATPKEALDQFVAEAQPIFDAGLPE